MRLNVAAATEPTVLEEIRIRGLGVIEESVLEVGPGLTVITGETGAGKTMVVTALGLLLGGRADSGAVRAGAKSARVEGLVNTAAVDGLGGQVAELGGDLDDQRLLIARQVSPEGRSRAFVGGVSVPAAALSSLVEPLVTVHGQSDQHRLLRAGVQRDALDGFAGETAGRLRAEFAELYRRLREVEAELDDVVAHARERAQEADLLRFGLAEVEAVAPRPGEDTELASEEGRLGFADTLRAAAEQARACLSADDGAPDAVTAIGAARKLLDGVRDHDPAVAELADRLAEVSYLLSDVAADVASYASGVETDPARLAAVSERRAALAGLTRKYGDTLEAVLDWSEQASRRLLALDGTDDRVGALREERDRLRVQLAETGVALSAEREAAAERLGAAVTGELAGLAMPHARFSVRVHQVGDAAGLDVRGRTLRMSASGLDEVEFLLAANQGAAARPLDKGASGGELSRVMLAVEVSLAASNRVPTFVFDEVDAGVGG